MKIIETSLDGAYLTELHKHGDKRGFFARSFCADEFISAGIEGSFIQQNMSETRQKHTLRGMHYQIGLSSEVKYIRCHMGAILDVIVDIRRNSATFMQHESFELSEDNYRGLYMPKGFAHGFITLTEKVVVSYLVSSPYSEINERGFCWDDPAFEIKWPASAPILSERDQNHVPFITKTMSLDRDLLED